jgi:hypothetical protein
MEPPETPGRFSLTPTLRFENCSHRALLSPYRPVRASGRTLARHARRGLSGGDNGERKRLVGAPEKIPQCLSYIDGQWHLWIYCCEWSLTLDGTPLAHNESGDLTMRPRCSYSTARNSLRSTSSPPTPAQDSPSTSAASCSPAPRRPAPTRTTGRAVASVPAHRPGPVHPRRQRLHHRHRHQQPGERHWLPINTPVHMHADGSLGEITSARIPRNSPRAWRDSDPGRPGGVFGRWP